MSWTSSCGRSPGINAWVVDPTPLCVWSACDAATHSATYANYLSSISCCPSVVAFGHNRQWHRRSREASIANWGERKQSLHFLTSSLHCHCDNVSGLASNSLHSFERSSIILLCSQPHSHRSRGTNSEEQRKVLLVSQSRLAK